MGAAIVLPLLSLDYYNNHKQGERDIVSYVYIYIYISMNTIYPSSSRVRWCRRRMAENYGGSAESSPHSDNESGGHMYNNVNSNNQDSSPIREQDRLLPIANVSRIMKKALPANAKISKDAKETVQECVSEFISFITGEASDKCQREKRKTINGDDLLWAMSTLGFEDYVEPLKLYLHKYRELEGEKVSMAKQGEQSSSKDGSTLSSAASVSFNGGMPPVSVMQPAYGQPQGSMVFGQHQMLAP